MVRAFGFTRVVVRAPPQQLQSFSRMSTKMAHLRSDLDPKKLRPQTWGLTTQPLISKRAEILKGRMSAPGIVKGFDVFKASL